MENDWAEIIEGWSEDLKSAEAELTEAARQLATRTERVEFIRAHIRKLEKAHLAAVRS